MDKAKLLKQKTTLERKVHRLYREIELIKYQIVELESTPEYNVYDAFSAAERVITARFLNMAAQMCEKEETGDKVYIQPFTIKGDPKEYRGAVGIFYEIADGHAAVIDHNYRLLTKGAPA